jgi:hypothetical protein
MGPHLICDKSSLEGLNAKELAVVRRYLTLQVPPVLLTEILADLSKEFKRGEPRDRVINLANRIVPLSSTICLSFWDIIDQELSGKPVALRGVPIITMGTPVQSSDGKSGMRFEDGPHEEALLRWQSGQFEVADEMTAKIWREYLKGIRLEEAQQRLRTQYPGLPRQENLAGVAQLVDVIMQQAKRDDLVSWFLEDAGSHHHVRDRFMLGLQRLPAGSLAQVAPYTNHCVRTALIFHLGLVNAVVGTKDTNRIDLEYLYYLPLSNGFSSGDNFLIDMAKVVLTSDQIFISAAELKADVKALAAIWEGFSPEEYQAEADRVGPPDNPDSATYRMWQKYMKPGYRQQKRLKLTPEKEKALMEKLRPVLDAAASGKPFDPSEFEGLDFSMRVRKVRLDSPCSCGSLKTFGECHGRNLKPG